MEKTQTTLGGSYLVLKVLQPKNIKFHLHFLAKVNIILFVSEITELHITNKMSGGDGREATPVPMPNTEVKLSSADGNWGLSPVRVGRCRA